jgi:hypothetical protein
MVFLAVAGGDVLIVTSIFDVAMVREPDHDANRVVLGSKMLREFGEQLPSSFRIGPIRAVKKRYVGQSEILNG